MTARSKKVLDYAALNGGDSDDDFSNPTPPQDVQPKKKSKLSKKKSDKSNTVYTSTQLDEVNFPVGRGGRPTRRPPEQVQFEKELEEALKISETETESSGEVIKKNVQDNQQNGASSAETLLLGRDDNPINVDDDIAFLENKKVIGDEHIKNPISRKIKQVELAAEENPSAADDSDDDFTIARTHKKTVVIESDDDDFEDKPRKTQSEMAVPKLNKKVSKKRKVDDGWVVSANKKKASNTKANIKPLEDSDDEFEVGTKESKPKTRTPPARVSKNKAINKVIDLNESDQSDTENSETNLEPKIKQKVDIIKQRATPSKKDVSDYEESSCTDEDSDDDFDPEVKTNNKTPAKKSVKKTNAETSPIIKKVKKTPKTTPTVKVKKTSASQIEKLTSPPPPTSVTSPPPPTSVTSPPPPTSVTSPPPPTSVKSPKKSYNSEEKSSRSPVKPLGLHNIPERKPAPITPVMSSLKLAPRTPLSFSGPKLAKTPSNHLNKVNTIQSPSLLSAPSPLITKAFHTPSPMGAKPKLGGGKIPAWTPPARVGEASIRASACASPSLGLRVGLSRNMKVFKPLHTNVKPE